MITRGAWIQWVDSKGNPTGYLGTVLYVYALPYGNSPREDSYFHEMDATYVRFMVRWDNGSFNYREREYFPGNRSGIILHDNPYPDPSLYWRGY